MVTSQAKSSAGTHFSEMASRPCRGGRQVVFGDVEPNQSAREMVNGLVAGGGALARRISMAKAAIAFILSTADC
jgi:hypothetical protein